MALNDIIFNRGQGGLGRGLLGEDHISGLIFYFLDANLPTGFGIADRIKQIFSIEEAEALGIIEGSANHAVLWYHINEYFRIQPQGVLFLGLFGSAAGPVIDLSKVETLQNFAEGKIRQMAVFNEAPLGGGGDTTTLQTSATNLETEHKPVQILYAADISGVADLSTLADLRALNNKNVSVVIGEDGDGAGAALAVTTGKSVTMLGSALGVVSLAKVFQSIAFVELFNLADGELDVPAFSNGDLVKDQAIPFLTSLKDKGYIFILKHVGISGSYIAESSVSISASSDFAFIENNRTIDKAVRGMRTFLLPLLNGPLLVNEDGTLSEDTIAKFKNEADRHLEQMVRDGELSFQQNVIDPAQNVLASSELVISTKLGVVRVARKITVNIGFALNL